MKLCGECKWFIAPPKDKHFGTCYCPFPLPKIPACYSLIKRDAWADMDFDCPFWDEK